MWWRGISGVLTPFLICLTVVCFCHARRQQRRQCVGKRGMRIILKGHFTNRHRGKRRVGQRSHQILKEGSEEEDGH